MKQINTFEFEKKFDEHGYIQIFVGRWIQEHRFVVQEFIGRELTNKEVVHHLNEIKTDNRVENLMIFPNQKEHQKFHYKLKRYGYLTNPMKRQIAFRWKDYK